MRSPFAAPFLASMLERRPASRPTPDAGLDPIRPGAWGAWARAWESSRESKAAIVPVSRRRRLASLGGVLRLGTRRG